jgi:hypothetical protein
MTRSIEEQLRTAQQKVNRLKTQVATKQKAEQRAKRKERDHKKYILAGNILKLLNMTVEESEKHLNLILGKLAELNNLEAEKVPFIIRRGDRILEDWKRQDEDNQP